MIKIGLNKIITFKVNGQSLKRTDKSRLVNKSQNVIIAKFNFMQSEWTGINRFVLFKNSTDTYNIPLEDGCEAECVIPWEVLNEHRFKMTLYGGDLITTNELTIKLEESGYTDEVTPTHDPTPDVFDKIFDELDTKATKVEVEELSEDINAKLDLKSDIGHLHTVSDITDFDDKTGIEIKKAFYQLTGSIRRYGE